MLKTQDHSYRPSMVSQVEDYKLMMSWLCQLNLGHTNLFLGLSGSKLHFFLMKSKCGEGKFSRNTNHIYDIHLFLMIFTFFFFFFLPAYQVPFFLNPVRETYNQIGMALLNLQIIGTLGDNVLTHKD